MKISNCKQPVDMKERAHKLCRDYLHGSWRNISAQELILQQISGGLSNLLYLCALPSNCHPQGEEPSQVLLRLYGQVHNNTDESDSVVKDSVIFTLLSERQLGPKLYGVFRAGRLEEYIPARCMTVQELGDPDLSSQIAYKMAQIHCLHVPITKEPKWLWEKMTRWLRTIKENLPKCQKDEEAQMARRFMDFNLEQEVQWLRKALSEIHSPVVFCHNDLQEGNILIRELTDDIIDSEERLMIIDFEYCSYNYRAFDLANHFCEYMYDYTAPDHPKFKVIERNYPSVDSQLHFIRSYMKHMDEMNPTDYKTDDIKSWEEGLLMEVEAFSLASHLFWGLWGVVNAQVSQIPFGYWEYAFVRLEAYFQLKESFLRTCQDQNGNIN